MVSDKDIPVVLPTFCDILYCRRFLISSRRSYEEGFFCGNSADQIKEFNRLAKKALIAA